MTFCVDELISIIKVGKLTSLCHLAIHGSTPGGSPMTFLNACPTLETLHLIQCTFPRNPPESKIDRPLENMKTFIEYDIADHDKGCKIGLAWTMRVCKDFPNLRKLKLENVKDLALRRICKDLVLLEELMILDANVTDSGVTGLSKHILGSTSKPKLKNKKIILKRHHYIGDLKYLRKLEIGSTNLTDLSITFGILNCRSVRNLTIYSPKITGKGLRSIVDEMNLVVLRTVCCYRIENSALKYAKIKLDDPENVVVNAEERRETGDDTSRFIKTYGVIHLEKK